MTQLFQNQTDVYDAMIDWPKRLAHEGPFYRRLFEQYRVRSMLDAACGTGHHAAMFHSWGLRVEASDLSPAMIDFARARFGEPDGLHWIVRSFDQPIAPAQPFDAVVCVGNSLPLAPDMATVQRAIRELFSAIRPGGLLVVHALNLWHLPDGPCVWQKCRVAALPQGDVLIVKGVHRCGRRGYVELIIAGLVGDRPMEAESTSLLGFEPEALESMARAAGADEIRFFGGYQNQPYDRQESIDLVMTAKKQQGDVGSHPPTA
jgi:glycine/sarcosine N-methyltransferase